MAEPRPADEPAKQPAPKPADAGPKLVAVPGEPRATAAPEPAGPRRGVSRWVVALLAVLLLLSLAGLAAQTQRAGAQAERIGALEAELAGVRGQLATANSQLESYDRTLGEVRGSVSELFERIAQLNALVQADPAAPGGAGAEPGPR